METEREGKGKKGFSGGVASEKVSHGSIARDENIQVQC